MNNKLTSALLAILVVGILVMAGPASAVSVSINNISDTTPAPGEVITFTAEVQVNVDESIQNVDVQIGNDRCYFTPDGNRESVSDLCNRISITKDSGDPFGYGGQTALQYTIRWDTTGFSGPQTVRFNVNTGSNTFSSSQTFIVGGTDTVIPGTNVTNGTLNVTVYDVTATSASFNATNPEIVTYDLTWGTIDTFSLGHIHGGTTYDTHLIARELRPGTTYQYVMQACGADNSCIAHHGTFTTQGAVNNANANSVIVCHVTGSGNQTLVINQNALNGHLNHGDTPGPCATINTTVPVNATNSTSSNLTNATNTTG